MYLNNKNSFKQARGYEYVDFSHRDPDEEEERRVSSAAKKKNSREKKVSPAIEIYFLPNTFMRFLFAFSPPPLSDWSWSPRSTDVRPNTDEIELRYHMFCLNCPKVPTRRYSSRVLRT